jgi:hypothetical protein
MNSAEICALFERRKSLTLPLTFQVGEENIISDKDPIDKLINLRGIEPSFSVVFFLPYECNLGIELFDVCGRRVATLLAPQRIRGMVELRWPQDIPHGVYYVVVSSEGKTFSRKVVLFR